jgi:DNA-binding NtrC family response regulator
MNKHILTVDDESEIRELLREILTASGYRVSGASSTAEAMRVVRDDTPDLIITDLQLEESDGFDLVEQVRAVAPKLPIIMLTGVLFDPQVLRGPIGEKIAAYVEKTAPLERVLQEVRRQLPA